MKQLFSVINVLRVHNLSLVKTTYLQALECALTLSALKNLSRDEAAIASLLVEADDEAAPELMISRRKHHDLSRLHSGKWSPEENNYANCIVDHFRNGSLQIPDGFTLRAVLADKLGCVSYFLYLSRSSPPTDKDIVTQSGIICLRTIYLYFFASFAPLFFSFLYSALKSPMRVTKTMSNRANGHTTGRLIYKRDRRLSNETMHAAQEELNMLSCIFHYSIR